MADNRGAVPASAAANSRLYGPASASALDAYVFSRLVERVNRGIRAPLSIGASIDSALNAALTSDPLTFDASKELSCRRADAVFAFRSKGRQISTISTGGEKRGFEVVSLPGVATAPGHGISSRTARSIYERFQATANKGPRGDVDRVRAMCAALREILPANECPAWLRYVTDGGPAADSFLAADAEELVKEFDSTVMRGVYPMSPVHESLSDLSLFMSRGNNILYVSTNQWPMHPVGGDAARPVYDLNDPRVGNLPVYEVPAKAREMDESKTTLRDAREWVEEQSGVKALQAFMTPEEYDAITDSFDNKSWLAGATDESGRTMFMPESRIRLVEGLMSRLYNDGITYKVERDDRPGQVKITFDNGMSMRIIDPYDNGQYAGARVYHRGLTIYYNQIRFVPNKQGVLDKAKAENFSAMTSDLSYQLVKVALGGQVENHVSAFHNEQNMRIMTSVAAETNSRLGTVAGQPLPENLRDDPSIPVLSVYFDNQMSNRTAEYSADPESRQFGGRHLMDAVASAREGVDVEFDAGRLARAVVAHRAERARFEAAMARYEALVAGDPDADVERPRSEDYDLGAPDFSGDSVVAQYQQDFWNVVAGDGTISEGLETDAPELAEAMRTVAAGLDAGPSSPEDVEARIRETVLPGLQDHLVGNLTFAEDGSLVSPEAGGARFDPVGTVRYMRDAYGVFRRTDELVAAARSIRLSDDFCKGEGFQNTSFEERLRRYAGEMDIDLGGGAVPEGGKYYSRAAVDAARRGETDLSAYEISGPQPGFGYGPDGFPTHWPMVEDGDPFVREMAAVVRDSLVRNGCVDVKDADVQIDADGTVHYEVDRKVRNYGKLDRVVGEIGPFCRQMGRYVGSPETNDERYDVPYPGLFDDGTRLFVPGNEGRIVPNKPGESLPYEARIRVTSYPQVFAREIERQLQLDLLTKPYNNRVIRVGTPTSVAHVTRHLFDTRFPRDFMEKDAEHGMSLELRRAIIETNRNRLKINDRQMEDSGRVALFRAMNSGKVDFLNDNFSSAIVLTDGRNPAILEETGDEFFDPVLTGNGGAIGIRYMRADRTVDRDGRIVPKSEAEVAAMREAGVDPSRCAIMDYLVRSGRCPDNDAMDRAIMTGQGLLHGLRETEAVGVAQVSLGAMTLEDGIVVSDRFARGNRVLSAGKDAVMRDLGPGDKMECHGNKGVVGAVIRTRDFWTRSRIDELNEVFVASGSELTDRQRSIHARVADDEYESYLLKTRSENPILARAIDLFNANPDLDVCMSPYSSVSRFNGGLAAEAMRDDRARVDLRVPVYGADGFPVDEGEFESRPGCVGHVKMTILEQTADSKTHFEMDGSENRSYGAQMTWALAAADAQEVLKDSFANNDRALVNLREMLLAVGMDVDQVGRIVAVDPDAHRGYNPQVVGHEEDGTPVYEERKVFQFPEPDLARARADARAAYDAMSPDERFEAVAGVAAKRWTRYKNLTRAEFDKLPVSTRDEMERRYLASSARDFLGEQEKEAMRAFDAFAQSSGGFLEIPFDIKYPGYSADATKDGHKFHTAETAPGSGRYLLPVMSSRLRSGREFPDGTMTTHDYTNQYIKIVQAAWDYGLTRRPDGALRVLGEELRTAKGELPSLGGKDINKVAQNAAATAQAEYGKISSDLATRRFSGKRNVFRSSIMAAKQRNSSTAIWTPDPSLPVDTVKMNPDMMRAIGLDPESSEPQYDLTHRDPVLQQSGIRYMRTIPAREDENIVGIAVNPAGIPGGMDGDFDGDTVGNHKPGSRAAHADAMRKLSVMANLLDRSKELEGVDWVLEDADGNPMPAFSLFIADGQDVAAGHAARPELRERRESLERRVNLFEQAAVLGVPVTLPGEDESCLVRERVPRSGKNTDGVTVRGLDDLRREALSDIDGYLRECFLAGFGRHAISYAGAREHIASILEFVDDGCKGSRGKVETYAAHAGINYSAEMENLDEVAFVHDDHRSVATREENVGILKSKEFQQAYTGMGGQSSIRGMKILMDIMPDATTRVTKAATHAILQCKHDAEMADVYEELLMGECRSIWRSQDDEGKSGNLTPEEFIEKFNATYNGKMKLGVSQHQLRQVVEAMTVDGHVIDIEGDEAMKFCSVMRRCAYGGNLDTVREVAVSTSAALARGEDAPGLFDVPEAAKGRARANYGRCMAGRQMQRNLESREGARAILSRDTQFEAAQPTSRSVEEVRSAAVDAGSRLCVTAGPRQWRRGDGVQMRKNAVGQIVLSPESSVFKGRGVEGAGHLYYVGPADDRTGGSRFEVTADEVAAARREFVHDAAFLSRVAADLPGVEVRVATFGPGAGSWDVADVERGFAVSPGEEAAVADVLTNVDEDVFKTSARVVGAGGSSVALGSDANAPYALVFKTTGPSGEPQTVSRCYSDPAQFLEYARFLAERVHEAWPEDDLASHLETVVPEDDLVTRYYCEAAMTNGRGLKMTESRDAWMARVGGELEAAGEVPVEAVVPAAETRSFVRASGDVPLVKPRPVEPVIETTGPEELLTAAPGAETSARVEAGPPEVEFSDLGVAGVTLSEDELREQFGDAYDDIKNIIAGAQADAVQAGAGLMTGDAAPAPDAADMFSDGPSGSEPDLPWDDGVNARLGRRDVGMVTIEPYGAAPLNRVFRDERDMLGDTLLNSWVCMAASGKSDACVRTKFDFKINADSIGVSRAAHLESGMRRATDLDGLKREFAVVNSGTVLECSDEGTLQRGALRGPRVSAGDFSAALWFSARAKSGIDGVPGKSVAAYRVYDFDEFGQTYEGMAAQAEFLTGVIERRWPGETAKEHKLTVVLNELCADKKPELERRLSEVSRHGFEVIVEFTHDGQSLDEPRFDGTPHAREEASRASSSGTRQQVPVGGGVAAATAAARALNEETARLDEAEMAPPF